MLNLRGKLLVVILFFAAVFATGEARRHLDDLTAPFRDDFREMLYLPRGDSLKLIACGFDAPLADALFIKGLIYYAESLDSENASAARAYSYELFDVITDLSPRFHRAYQVGATFLSGSASIDANRNGIKLLDKGIGKWDEMVAKGEKIRVDPRWLFHTLAASTYEVNIQARSREAGDLSGAAEARVRAVEGFRKAAASPGAPEAIIAAASGYQSIANGDGDAETANLAVLAVWSELYERAVEQGDKEMASDFEKRIETVGTLVGQIRETKGAEQFFSDVGRAFLKDKGRPAEGLAELVRTGYLRGLPPEFPLDLKDDEVAAGNTEQKKDVFLALPDGSFKSWRLAQLQTTSVWDVLFDAVVKYRRVHSLPPQNLQMLVDEKFLDRLPEPPLKELGQTYGYSPESGLVALDLPQVVFLPPDRQ